MPYVDAVKLGGLVASLVNQCNGNSTSNAHYFAFLDAKISSSQQELCAMR